MTLQRSGILSEFQVKAFAEGFANAAAALGAGSADIASTQNQPILDIKKQLEDLRELNKEIERQQKILNSLDTPDKLERFGEAPTKALERLIPLAERLESKFGPEQLRLIEQEISRIQATIAKAPPPQFGRSFTEGLEKELAFLEKIRDRFVAITGEFAQAPAAAVEPSAIDEFIQSLNDQLKVLGEEGKARAQLRAEIQLQNIARREEIALTPEMYGLTTARPCPYLTRRRYIT